MPISKRKRNRAASSPIPYSFTNYSNNLKLHLHFYNNYLSINNFKAFEEIKKKKKKKKKKITKK
jgi:hypothetical protein